MANENSGSETVSNENSGELQFYGSKGRFVSRDNAASRGVYRCRLARGSQNGNRLE